ncbi:MAG TPA: 4-hydroxy-3-methylbut-2-enyl diphosphate reductase [Opitutaceae bacterium]|nr:4-hydroxy-3-methylbut-2-enyl diphosphate reductase [Opitutaceae bacterium]
MSSPASSGSVAAPALVALLAFNPRNQLAVRRAGNRLGLAFAGPTLEVALDRLRLHFPRPTPPAEYFTAEAGGVRYRVFFTQVDGPPADAEVLFRSLDDLTGRRAELAPSLAAAVDGLEPHLIEIPYLHLGENEYIYRFRVEKERNHGIYAQDATARALYQSRLCEAIKALNRTHERSASRPAVLDFGAVCYVIPSHFGFCLGVKNAIERAYETLAENPGRRVFMLSELIHNPFVNEDLLRRGLRFLQTDKGRPFTVSGRLAEADRAEPLLWDTLTTDDIVIIPAFGATDEDKKKLVRRGIAVAQYDATCMLVEKVWKAARAFGRDGFTVIIHGKAEHEETKATFSNSRRFAPSLIIRDLAEARLIGRLILEPTAARRAEFAERFGALCTPGFDLDRHLARVAVVNQTTLLTNETIAIIDYFRSVFRRKHGEAAGDAHVGGSGKKDTLCYATQVNQDALGRALAEPLDVAFVIGGKNSSNTYQLFRLCEQKMGAQAYFIQSEENIRSRDEVQHYVFPTRSHARTGGMERRPLPAGGAPLRVLITGGASCPDGLIQQVVTRINGFFPADRLRPIEAVLADLPPADPPA